MVLLYYYYLFVITKSSHAKWCWKHVICESICEIITERSNLKLYQMVISRDSNFGPKIGLVRKLHGDNPVIKWNQEWCQQIYNMLSETLSITSLLQTAATESLVNIWHQPPISAPKTLSLGNQFPRKETNGDCNTSQRLFCLRIWPECYYHFQSIGQSSMVETTAGLMWRRGMQRKFRSSWQGRLRFEEFGSYCCRWTLDLKKYWANAVHCIKRKLKYS